MSVSQLDKAYGVIDESLRMNRDEILKYIEEHPDEVARALRLNGEVLIPTSAGLVTVLRPEEFATTVV